MDFKCECSLKNKLTGDGCQKCNTSYAIDMFPKSVKLYNILEDAGFSSYKTAVIIDNIIEPIMSFITTLNEKIDEIAEKIN